MKLFVTASDECRARRRFLELADRGVTTTEDAVLADLRARDARDSGRAAAPLRPAPDAVRIDTTDMSIEEAVAAAIAAVERRRRA